MEYRSPATVWLPNDNEETRNFLTFRDRSVDFQLKKLKSNFRWKQSDPQSFIVREQELKEQSKRCLVMVDQSNGRPYTYAGLAKELEQRFKWPLPTREGLNDSQTPLPMLRSLPEPFYYQKEAVDALCAVGHGAISLPTGAGKSWIILELARRFNMKTVIVTPAAAITDQLFQDMVKHFGVKYVGKYGDGSKTSNKQITIATGQALTRLEKGDKHYDNISSAQLLCFDESHRTPSDIFEKVCLGVCENAKYRFFVSATQIRNDGSEMLLNGIIGPIVYHKDFRELVDQGYLAKPYFKIFNVQPKTHYNALDPKKETRNQLYLNPNVNALAAEIASKSVLLAGRQTLVIVEQFDQFVQLEGFLTVPCVFVHGGAGKDVKDILPQKYWDCDIDKAVADFNSKKIPLLVGTSAISTGVDTKSAETVIYLQGGTSEVKIKQAVGRGTRIKGVPGKKDLWVIDFLVSGSDIMERHLAVRRGFYESLSDEVIEINAT